MGKSLSTDSVASALVQFDLQKAPFFSIWGVELAAILTPHLLP